MRIWSCCQKCTDRIRASLSLRLHRDFKRNRSTMFEVGIINFVKVSLVNSAFSNTSIFRAWDETDSPSSASTETDSPVFGLCTAKISISGRSYARSSWSFTIPDSKSGWSRITAFFDSRELVPSNYSITKSNNNLT